MRLRLAFVVAAAVTLSACAATRPAGQTGPIGMTSDPPPPTLAVAIRRSAHLGPAGSDTMVSLTFALKVRQPSKLAAIIASGRAISPAQYAASFAPDPALVVPAVAALRAGGFSAGWRPGSELITADGPAPAAASFLHVDLESYRLPDGSVFYAALDAPRLPAALAAVATSVSGLDNYRRARAFAVRPGGMTPTDILAFYNIKPLRDLGLDGAGQTIVLPEIDDLPNLTDVNAFASKFGLPSFDPILTVKRDPSWGTPEKPQGETVLDLEVIHEVAPAAKIVVYLSAPDFGHGDRAFDQMVTDHLGSIISESLGTCETDADAGHRNAYATIEDRAVAQGMSHFVASGDSGAYTCGLDQDPAASFPSTLPTVTAVGGTTVFESQQGIYFKESAWGSPIDESGSGGGPSLFYPLPSWQKNEAQSLGHGERQVPDVAAGADPMSGYSIVFGGKAGQAGGTSAATPLWAATVALIDQDLKKRGMREVGFANPAIYYMGENASRFAARPFHDVTFGNNLGYDATAGWDFATGWGSMDAMALDNAWATYIKGGGA